MRLSRRKLITGLIAFGCTPAIVRASSLMPVKVMETSIFDVDECQKIINEIQSYLYDKHQNVIDKYVEDVFIYGNNGFLNVWHDKDDIKIDYTRAISQVR